MKNLFNGLRVGSAAACLALWTLVGCGTGSDGQNPGSVVTGHACASSSDCSSGQVCGFPTAAGCAASTPGVCLIYPSPGVAHCNSVILACSCSGSQVGIPCDYPSGYAPAPIKSGSTASCL